jgi:hypothetical protein
MIGLSAESLDLVAKNRSKGHFGRRVHEGLKRFIDFGSNGLFQPFGK